MGTRLVCNASRSGWISAASPASCGARFFGIVLGSSDFEADDEFILVSGYAVTISTVFFEDLDLDFCC